MSKYEILSLASDKEYFSVQMPKSFKDKRLKLKIFTSFRKRPFKGVLLPMLENSK